MRALAGQLHEVRALERRLREEDAVVGDDRHGIAPDVREAAHERVAVERLELGEARAVDEPRDHLAHVERRALVGRDHARELLGVAGGLLGRQRLERAARRGSEPRHRLAQQREGVLVRARERVGDARDARVHVGAAELLRGHFLARRGLHERWPCEEDRPRALHDHALVAHRRHVRAARRAGAHHGRELRNAVAPTCAPGCRRCARSGRGRGRPRPAAAGRRRPNRRGRCRAGGSRARSPAPAGAS